MFVINILSMKFYLSQIMKKGKSVPEIVWNCGECAKDFATERQLKAHVRKEHPQYLPEEAIAKTPVKKRRIQGRRRN